MSSETRMHSGVWFSLALLAAGNVLGIAGIDLVLPAIPSLPQTLGGTAATAQLVLASFVAGTAGGLLLFGNLGHRVDQRWLLAISLTLYALMSFACAVAPNIGTLIALRFLQGASGSAAVVFGPGFIRRLLPPDKAVRMIGLIGSIESLVPAFAPVIGAFLLVRWGWAASFHLSAALTALLALASFVWLKHLPQVPPMTSPGSYQKLLRDPTYLRYALSQAFVLGGLLTFVFGAPSVIVHSWGGVLSDFIRMQMIAVFSYIVAANSAQKAVARWGSETMIHLGTWLAAFSGVALFIYGLIGGRNPMILIPLFLPMNVGLGLRGPPGFFQAIVAAKGDDARGSALVILAIMGTSALGTALVAPFIEQGLPALGAVTAGILLAAVGILRWK
ncbi:MAG TPA: MFS transporter [Oligoflexus sp.]|uniref:MFS transporter n=1 Tax=Oligoflexus sp. TaxID=1971216 RepID=UPI002D31B95E|nr:MFS transporter [Oligoflexus sp.]HYX31531.1 MFS transporter [Oligoflexus sp.]